MNHFTEEHDLFRQTVREFMEKEVAPHAEEWEDQGRLPREIFQRMGDLGFLGINHSERYGGADADIFYSLAFLEELARSTLGGFCAAVGVQQYMATAHIYRFGTEWLKQRYVAPSIAGVKVGALAVTEPDCGSDVAAIRTSAVREGDAYVVNGAKTWITNGAEGDFLTLAVKTDRDAGPAGVSLLVVDHDMPGVRVTRRIRKLGWHCSDTAELAFEQVRVPVSHLIGEEGKGFYYIMDAFQLERLVAAATAIGGSHVALEQTLAYMKQREAFGRPIARFQALRHRMVDLFAELEAVRHLTYHCAWLHQQGDNAVRETSMAKLLATELGKRISDECLQMYGGFGYAEEFPVARAYRDARVGTIAGGTSEIMREILAKMIFDRVSFERAEVPDQRDEDPGPLPSRRPREAAPSDALPTTEGVAPPAVPVSGEMPDDIESLMRALPHRHRPEKTAGWAARFHFRFQGSPVAEWTVVIKDASCQVAPGLEGQPDCVVNASADVYLGIERGTQDPQMAFLMGKVKVSNLGHMQRFMKAFRPIKGRK